MGATYIDLAVDDVYKTTHDDHKVINIPRVTKVILQNIQRCFKTLSFQELITGRTQSFVADICTCMGINEIIYLGFKMVTKLELKWIGGVVKQELCVIPELMLKGTLPL